MTINLRHKFGQGLSPQEFVDKMTKNQEQFQSWYNQFSWPDSSLRGFFEGAHTDNLRCTIIAADWCGDVVRNVPAIFRLMETANIPTEVLVMEEHLDVMDEFLTMGGRSIPVVLFVSAQGDVVGRWGPRPQYVQEPMVAFKSANTDKNAPDYEENLKAARQEIMRRYGEGTGYQKLIAEEIKEILERI
ncbi:thioredoxin family protein [Alicyclobacillus dauci]|uniref:Thioredoxin family protein n=1 Tax=Alicyclobacillus dauci TaxID=1475485 RepID=A0ABY6YZK9_9BACL|nr:thioredoxin family protein [Alicyclobacillus dauci]WAH36075.1 thioredoxin family protein [Alicyclobacillus dauci]